MMRSTVVLLTVLVTPIGHDQAVFRTQTDSVLLDVLATDRSGVIQNLRAADIEVRDNGVLQTLTLVSDDVAPLSVSLLLDTSGSLSTRELENLRRGASAVAMSLRPGDELGLRLFRNLSCFTGWWTPPRARAFSAGSGRWARPRFTMR